MTAKIDEIKASLTEVEGLIYSEDTPQTLSTEEKEKTNELLLDELRIIYGRLDESLATVKLRILTFLGASLALLSYLYGGGSLFIPQQNYGKVLYALGLGLTISAIGFLMRGIRSQFWGVPIESKLTKMHRYKTRLALLEILIEEYTECLTANINRYETKVTYLNSGFFQLLCGGILLLVIKSIGG